MPPKFPKHGVAWIEHETALITHCGTQALAERQFVVGISRSELCPICQNPLRLVQRVEVVQNDAT